MKAVSLPRSIDTSKRVQVYFNLHKRTFSVKQGGRVVAHMDSLDLIGARFLVRESGRQRVIREKRKNVHAFVSGYISNYVETNLAGYVPVRYNPYEAGYFKRLDTQQPVWSAMFALLRNDDKPSIHIVGVK